MEKKEVTVQQVKVNAKTSKWKEGREVITCIDCHPPNTAFIHSLSFTLMAKT